MRTRRGVPRAGAECQVLADDLGIATENTAKWWHTHLETGQGFAAGQLVILDEYSVEERLVTRLIAFESVDTA